MHGISSGKPISQGDLYHRETQISLLVWLWELCLHEVQMREHGSMGCGAFIYHLPQELGYGIWMDMEVPVIVELSLLDLNSRLKESPECFLSLAVL